MWTNDEMQNKLGQIHNQDCLTFMKQVPDKYFDLVLTDLPYGECDVDNNGIWDKNTNMTDMHKADKVGFEMQVLLAELDRICKGSYYIFCGIEQVSDIKKYFSKKHTTRLIIWEKTNPMPINGQYVFLSGIETCIWVKKSGATFNESCRNTVFRYPLGIDTTDHPTTKPIKLFTEFLRISTKAGDKVFDPFVGSGTTPLACEGLPHLKLEWVATEINPDYVAIANKRLEKVQGSLF